MEQSNQANLANELHGRNSANQWQNGDRSGTEDLTLGEIPQWPQLLVFMSVNVLAVTNIFAHCARSFASARADRAGEGAGAYPPESCADPSPGHLRRSRSRADEAMKLSGMGRTLRCSLFCAPRWLARSSHSSFFSAAQGQNASAAQAGKRVALVIGNGSYPHRLSVRRLQTRKGSLSS